MPKEIGGNLSGEGLRFAVVVSRFNHFITARLLEGTLDGLSRCGVREEDITIVRVPGAFEIPPAARRLAETGRYHGVICIGAVIRGDTPHFEFVAGETSRGVARVALETGIPVIYGILTADTLEQAIERAGSKQGNRGWDAALQAIEMANLFRTLEAESG